MPSSTYPSVYPPSIYPWYHLSLYTLVGRIFRPVHHDTDIATHHQSLYTRSICAQGVERVVWWLEGCCVTSRLTQAELGCMSKCPWARYWTPPCIAASAISVWMCLWMGECGKYCKVVSRLEKPYRNASPFTIYNFTVRTNGTLCEASTVKHFRWSLDWKSTI